MGHNLLDRDKALHPSEYAKQVRTAAEQMGGIVQVPPADLRAEPDDTDWGDMLELFELIKFGSAAKEADGSVDIDPLVAAMEERLKAASPSLMLRPDVLTRGLVTGDGSCQFLAVADQCALVQGLDYMQLSAEQRMEAASKLRKQAVLTIQSRPELANFVVGGAVNVPLYLQDTTWGDHVTVTALALALQRRIKIYSTQSDRVLQVPDDATITPSMEQQAPLVIAHIFEVHYRSVVEAPAGRKSTKRGSAVLDPA